MRASDGTLRLGTPSPTLRRLEGRETAAWRPRKTERASWFSRILRRRQPTTYERCLAIHIHYAGPRSALS